MSEELTLIAMKFCYEIHLKFTVKFTRCKYAHACALEIL
ncbi:unnamed protein product [Lathyrus oleraceus]